jgi:ankyrin repeat protein
MRKLYEEARALYGDSFTFPLYVACGSGHVDVLRLLLAGGADVDKALMNGNTSLHIACCNGDTAVASVLLAAGANIQVGHSPLYIACIKGHAEVVRLLLASGDGARRDQGAFFLQENTLSSKLVGLQERSPKLFLKFFPDQVRG